MAQPSDEFLRPSKLQSHSVRLINVLETCPSLIVGTPSFQKEKIIDPH